MFFSTLQHRISSHGLAGYRIGIGAWQTGGVNDVLANVTEWLTVPEAAEKLNVPLGRVRRMLEEHQLISARRDGVVKIPAEVIVDGEPLASLHGTMIVLLDCVLTPEQAVEWLYTFDDSLPGTPMEFLLKGHKSAVRRLAMLLA
ncbi:MAG: hypothetical protein RIS82_1159 [Actinomycetota bacterium]